MKFISLICVFLLQQFSLCGQEFRDRIAEFDHYKAVSKKLFDQRNWQELDDLFNSCRDAKETLSNGEPKLFAYGLGIMIDAFHNHRDSDEEWSNHLKLLSQWDKAVPESVTVTSYKIQFWNAFAWKARGNDFASNVPKDGWQPFRERLNTAESIFRKTLERYKNQPYPCPIFYTTTMTTALGQGWEVDKVLKELLNPVIKIYPEYYKAYSLLSLIMEPKWGGKENDDYRFYAMLPELLNGELGKEMYARLLLVRVLAGITDFQRDLLDWELMKDGFVIMLKKGPECQYQLCDIIKFAHRYGAKAEILALAKETVPDLVDTVSNNNGYVRAVVMESREKNRAWVVHKDFQVTGANENTQLKDFSYNPIYDDMTFSCSNRGIKIYDIDADLPKIEWQIPRVVMLLTKYSPDGKNLLVTSRDDSGKAEMTGLSILAREKDSLSPVSFSPMKYNVLGDVEFSHDGKKVYLTHRADKREENKILREIYVWDWEKKSPPARIHHELSGPFYTRLELSPSKREILSCDPHLYQIPIEGESKAPGVYRFSKELLGTHVEDFTFIENGKTLVVSSPAESGSRKFIFVDYSTGKMLGSVPAPHLNHMETHIGSVSTKSGDFITTSGLDGVISLWKIIREDGKYAVNSAGTYAGDGSRTCFLDSFTSKDGRSFVVNGTYSGSVRILEVER